MNATKMNVGHDQQEVEWQFDVVDARPVERWLAARADVAEPAVSRDAVHHIVDRYFDTDDWRVLRAGYVLRVRSQDGRPEATLKGRESGTADYRSRREITQPLESAAPDAVFGMGGPVADRVRFLVGPHPLRLVFSFETQRRVFFLTSESLRTGEMTLDDTSIDLGEGIEPVRLRRVELETTRDQVERLRPFVDQLRVATGLQRATLSKFEFGLVAHGLAPELSVDLGPLAFEPEMTIGEVTYAVLRKHFGAFLEHEPGTRFGDDPEELHDMRVAARRLRAALSLFRDALPLEAERMREELSWVASALGTVRDIDVQLEQLAQWIEEAEPEDREGLQAIDALLRTRWATARDGMLSVLDDARYDRFVADFGALLRRGPEKSGGLGGSPALAVAPRLITRRYRRVRKAGDQLDAKSPPEAFHELRILGKRLRYAVEFLSPLYDRPAQRLVESTVAMQDLLGAHQDAYVAVAFLRGLAAEESQSLPGRAIFAMGRVAQRYADSASTARSDFPAVYSGLKGKRWQALERRMDRRRPDEPPPLEQPEPEQGAPERAGG